MINPFKSSTNIVDLRYESSNFNFEKKTLTNNNCSKYY